MNAERRSLQDAFAPATSRGSKLEGLLPPKRRNTEIPKSSGTEPRIEKLKEDSPQTPVKAEGRTKSVESTKASEQVPGAFRNVGVYIEPELLVRLKDWTRLNQTTYADLLVEAFDHVEDTVIAEQFEPEKISAGSGMPRRVRRPRGTAGIQIQLRLDGDQVEWLGEKAKSLGAPSRSACVSTVFKLYMGHTQN